MSDHTQNISEAPPVGNLTDFVEDVIADDKLYVEVSVDDTGKVVLFHNKRFKMPVSWFEFDLQDGKLEFILEDGKVREPKLPLSSEMTKYMHNSHQILMVRIDDETGDANDGHYVPLILHSA